MRKLFVTLSIGAALVGSFAVAACVGDDPAPGPGGTGVAPGANPDDASTGSDSSTPGTDAEPAGPQICKFQPTTFPCGNGLPSKACYGATQSCTETLCGGTDITWACNSARQCGTACCVPDTAATLAAGANCAEGTLLIKAGTVIGAACATDTVCKAGETQLCQANSDCPKGQRCTPVKIIGAGAAFNGNIVAACAP